MSEQYADIQIRLCDESQEKNYISRYTALPPLSLHLEEAISSLSLSQLSLGPTGSRGGGIGTGRQWDISG